MQTVCSYWLKGLCMKGEDCGFLHVFDPARLPVCRNLIKFGECKEPDCPFKHSLEDVKVSSRSTRASAVACQANSHVLTGWQELRHLKGALGRHRCKACGFCTSPFCQLLRCPAMQVTTALDTMHVRESAMCSPAFYVMSPPAVTNSCDCQLLRPPACGCHG